MAVLQVLVFSKLDSQITAETKPKVERKQRLDWNLDWEKKEI
jgi:hypothetical protein